MDVSTTALRVLREIAELGSFTAAAASLGYTQPAVSRQIAVLEREVGASLFDRSPSGARLTPAGSVLLGRARVVLTELDGVAADLSGEAPERHLVRMGLYVSAGSAVLAGVLRRLRRDAPWLRLTTREGTSPSLVRSLRAGTLDLAVITSRPPHRAPDSLSPRLHLERVTETELRLAVAATSRFAGRESVALDELGSLDWVASPSSGTEPMLGVWPGLESRVRPTHVARDWLTKLTLVASGEAITTVPSNLADVLPDGVRTVRVRDSPAEVRRMRLVRLPGPASDAVAAVSRAVHAAA